MAQVAKVIETEYDSPADALGLPILMWAMAAAFLASAWFVGVRTYPRAIFATFSMLLGVLSALQGIITSTAAVVYAREPTELPR